VTLFTNLKYATGGSLSLNKVLLNSIRLVEETFEKGKGKTESKRDNNIYLIIIYSLASSIIKI
jgi:hypothetical protein